MEKKQNMTDKELIANILTFIEDNLDHGISLDEVADFAGYSKYHLNRLFTEVMECTIFKYIQTRRLDNAAKELVMSDRRIIDIALEAGYGSQQAFTLAFRKEYLISPQQYRVRKRYTPVHTVQQITSMHSQMSYTGLWRTAA